MTENRYQPLFDPVKIGPVTAPNRFYAVPHATGHGWMQPEGAIALHGMKAEGGWGTVAVQMCEIAPTPTWPTTRWNGFGMTRIFLGTPPK